MSERQEQHNAALANNEWIRANYAIEEDVRGNRSQFKFWQGAAFAVAASLPFWAVVVWLLY